MGLIFNKKKRNDSTKLANGYQSLKVYFLLMINDFRANKKVFDL